MVVTANTSGISRKRMRDFVAALIVLLSVLSTFTSAARATETKDKGGSSTPGIGAKAWYPSMNPSPSDDREAVFRNLSLTDRTTLIDNCPYGNLCVAAGEGDGEHTVWRLYYCTVRALSNFIGEDAVFNNQTGNASTILLDKNRVAIRTIKSGPGAKPVRVNWDKVWYIDVC